MGATLDVRTPEAVVGGHVQGATALLVVPWA